LLLSSQSIFLLFLGDVVPLKDFLDPPVLFRQSEECRIIASKKFVKTI